MKTIQRSLLISIIPFLLPLTTNAETEQQQEIAKPIAGTKGGAASWRASQVMGLSVKNSADETIGDVKDLVLDMKKGEILAVVISSGGFLGMADTLSAVPVTALRYDVSKDAFMTSLTKEQLGKAPQFKTNAWPDYNDDKSIEALRSYRDTVGGDVTAPDNTAQNEREVRKDAVNPTDQGNSEKDVQVTQDIRSGIVGTDLSFNAKNIKIITRDGNVTLKGVVESSAEHQAVLTIARKYASAGKLNDDLKVKSN